MALFRLAWSAKVQIPVLITVVFMACDIRLQLEINIFWETNNARPHANHLHGTNRSSGGRRSSREDMRRAALVASALYQQQRRRLIQEMRAQQANQREVARRQSLPVNAPLATEEDSDLDGSHDGNFSDSDTLTCSHRSTTSEAGSLGSYEDDDEGTDMDDRENQVVTKKKRKVKRSRPSSREPDEDDDEEDDSTTDEDEDDDDDDDEGGHGGGNNGGSSSHGGGGYPDHSYDDNDSDDMDDSSQGDVGGGGGYSSPLVLEIELRHRPLLPPNENDCQTFCSQSITQNLFYLKNVNVFSRILKQRYLRSSDKTGVSMCTSSMRQHYLQL